MELARRYSALREGTYRLLYDDRGRDRALISATFREVAQSLFEQRAIDKDWRHQTKAKNESRLKVLVELLGSKRLTDMSPHSVEKLRRVLRDSVSGPTVNRYIALLSGMLQVAVQNGDLVTNPARGVGRFKENETAWSHISPDEADRLLDACAESLRPIVACALYTGMRAGEIRALRWQDVDLKLSVIWIRNSKSGKPREVPIHEILKRELLRVKRTGSKCEYVFTKPDGTHYKDWRGAWLAATDAASPYGLRFHDLRHTFGTWHLAANTNPYVTQDLMGHVTNHMTRRYSHVTMPVKRAAIENMPRVGEQGKVIKIAPTQTPTQLQGARRPDR
jgi:integrase